MDKLRSKLFKKDTPEEEHAHIRHDHKIMKKLDTMDREELLSVARKQLKQIDLRDMQMRGMKDPFRSDVNSSYLH
jgi:hypothetical protein